MSFGKSKKFWKEKKRVKKSAKKPPRSSKASRRNVKKRVKRHKRTLTNLQALETHYQTSEKEFSKKYCWCFSNFNFFHSTGYPRPAS